LSDITLAVKRKPAWKGLAIVAAAVLLALLLVRKQSSRRAPVVSAVTPRVDPSYALTVQPIFDRRCVVCHSCLDAPCQLNLQSFEGVDRGANAVRVYEPTRPVPIHPTRMFQDAQTTAEWQGRLGFFPVLTRPYAASAATDGSILERVIEQRSRVPVKTSVFIDAPTTCPARISEVDEELTSSPDKGMPYGFPPLDAVETRAIIG